jgi:hypothetical protein
MENHPIMFAALIVIWTFYAMFYIIKVTVLVLIALCKWIVKKIKKTREVDNNVAN